MATRHARTADKALNEKHSRILKDLLKRPANKYCADCKKKDPRWASWNIGVFVCIRCSGVHRSMGTHISKVKSVDLDTWVPDQVENMVRWGNERANKYWEANLKDKRPSESNIDMWIRAKYDQKRWAMKGPIPDPSTLGVGDDDDALYPASASDVSASNSPAPAYRQAQIPSNRSSPKPKPSEFANLDAFLSASPSPTSSPARKPAVAQLQGADFFFDAPKQQQQQQQQQQPTSPPKQQHDDLKSSILSLYNQIPSSYNSPSTVPASAAGMMMNNNGANAGLYNMSNFQQQLSGLSLGSSGVIPQAPANHNFQANVWGSFADASTAPMQPATIQQHQQTPAMLPQGSQFFGSSFGSSNKSNGTHTAPAPTKPAYDAFADLLK